MKEPTCETCKKELAAIYDFSGENRAVWVCWDCGPPRIFCRDCCAAHTHAPPVPDQSTAEASTGEKEASHQIP